MIKHKFRVRRTCRLCKSKNLTLIHKYNNSPLCDEFLKIKKKQYFYPLKLQKCKDCLFVQINTTVEPKEIYDNYLYLSHTSSGLSDHFADYAKDVIKKLKISRKLKIIDIGSNDGVLCKHFKRLGHEVYGVEPFKAASDEANNNNIRTINSYFDKNLSESFLKIIGKVDVICINNLFANIDDLKDFTKNCSTIIKNNGYLIIESSYLFSMLKKNIFDFVYHEHLSYFSIIPLMKFMKNFDLRIVNITKSNSKGGSFRYFFQKSKSAKKISSKLNNLILNEKNFYKNFDYIVLNFCSNITKLRNNFERFFQINAEKKIAAFGASATSTTFLSEINIGSKIDVFIDENPAKINKYSPGFGIKVISLEKLNKEKVDIVIILAWRFRHQIIAKLKKYNVNFLIPLPTFKFYEKNK